MSLPTFSTEIRIGPIALRLHATRAPGGWQFQANGVLLDSQTPHLPAPTRRNRHLPNPTRSRKS